MKKGILTAALASFALVVPGTASAHRRHRTHSVTYSCRSEYWQLANELDNLQNERAVIAADLGVLQQDYTKSNAADFTQTMSVEMAVVNAMSSTLNNATTTLGLLGGCAD